LGSTVRKWIKIFSVDELELMGPELVKEFDNLVENFYGNFVDDFKGYAESEIYIGFICADAREEDFVVESSYPNGRLTHLKRTGGKVESVPVYISDETDAVKNQRN
jgi:hypothetical protein